MKKILWERYSQRKNSEEDDEESVKDFPFKHFLEKNVKFVEDDFNLWVLHTNFPVMESDAENVEECTGVETLDVWSPFRIRIGIGRLFDEEKCKKEIEFVINSGESLELLDEGVQKEVSELLESFKEMKWWAILILPNGKIVSYTGKSEEDIAEKVEFFETVQEVTSSQLLTN